MFCCCLKPPAMPAADSCMSLSAAVMQVAGQSSGINVVDKAQSAVNTVKIINALNEISDILKVCPSASYMQSAERTASMHSERMEISHYRMMLSWQPALESPLRYNKRQSAAHHLCL